MFEFKLNGTAEQALQQIDEKGYLIPYQADDREVVKVGVEFSAEKKEYRSMAVVVREICQACFRKFFIYMEKKLVQGSLF